MEILDCFCGVGPWPFRDRILPYRASEVLALMDYFGIGQALVYPNGARDWGRPGPVNRLLLEDVAGESRFIPAFALSQEPDADDPVGDCLAAMRAAGAKAAWLWPRASNRAIPGTAAWLLGPLFEQLRAAQVPVLIHADALAADALAQLLADFPGLRLVLVGASYTSDTWLYPLLAQHPHLSVCLGHFYIPEGNPEQFVRRFGAERLLFGSGLPDFSPGGLIGHLMYARLSDEQKALILAGNARRLLAEVRL